MGVSLSPAISKHPRAFLYGWLPLSNASGISSLAIQHKMKHLRHFLINPHDTIDLIESINLYQHNLGTKPIYYMNTLAV